MSDSERRPCHPALISNTIISQRRAASSQTKDRLTSTGSVIILALIASKTVSNNGKIFEPLQLPLHIIVFSIHPIIIFYYNGLILCQKNLQKKKILLLLPKPEQTIQVACFVQPVCPKPKYSIYHCKNTQRQ